MCLKLYRLFALENLIEIVLKVCSKLKQSHKLLGETRQPYSYLIESMRKRDEELEQQRCTIVQLEDELDQLKSDNKEVGVYFVLFL